MKGRNTLLTICLIVVFLIIVLLYLYELHPFALSSDGWVIADWLINYSAGFERRGLSGFIILGISDLLGVKANLMVYGIQAIFYISYLSILFALFYEKKINIWFVILLLSPATLLFQVYDEMGIGRKEIILYFLFGLYILFLNKKILSSTVTVLLFSILLSVAVLFHELIFFYTPYFLLVAYLKSKRDHESLDLKRNIYLFLLPLLTIGALFLFGKEINGAAVCTDLLKRGLGDKICQGILSMNYDVKSVAIDKKYFSGYSISFLLSLIPYLLFVKYSTKIITVKRFLMIFFVLILFSLPLFVLAIDWGRWISIHFMMLLFVFTMLLENKSENLRLACVEEDLTIPNLFRTKNKALEISGKLIFISAATYYLMTWYFSHCFYPFNILYPLYHYDGIKDLLHNL